MAVGVSQYGVAVKQHVNEETSSSLLLPTNVSSVPCLLQTPNCFNTDRTETGFVKSKKKTALMEEEMGDVFFGADDVNCMKDLVCKEDVIDCMRRKAAMKSFRRRRNNRKVSITECFEFLKLICCLRF